MPQTPFDFADLLCRAREHCPEATQQLHDRFKRAVQQAVRRHFNNRIRPKVDPEDLAQEVWLAFFSESLFTHDFTSPQHLLDFLDGVARHKTLQQIRRYLTRPSHDIHLERSLDASLPLQYEEARSACEQWGQLMEGQPPELRRVLRQLAEGQTLAGIADDRGSTMGGLKRWLLGRLFQRSA